MYPPLAKTSWQSLPRSERPQLESVPYQTLLAELTVSKTTYWLSVLRHERTVSTTGSRTMSIGRGPVKATGCGEPGIDGSYSMRGSGWFYSGYSGFHPNR